MSRLRAATRQTLPERHRESVKIGVTSKKIGGYIHPVRKPVLGDRTNLLKVNREDGVVKDYNSSGVKRRAGTCEPLHVGTVRLKSITENDFQEIPMEVDEENDVDEDIDETDAESLDDKVLYVTAYGKYIFKNLWEAELKYLLSSNFLTRHKLITSRMRYVLVDWLCKVHSVLNLSLDSFHLTVLILDQYLDHGDEVTKENLQLIGTTALLLASKFEDITPPLVSELSEATENAISTKEILDCEMLMLRKLDFNVNLPLPITFYRRLSRLCNFSAHQHCMGKYLLEICLVECDLCFCRPSMMAAAVVLLVLRMFHLNNVWSDKIQRCAFYSEKDLTHIITTLARCVLRHTQKSRYRAVREKYALKSNCCISSFNSIIKSDAVLATAQIF